MATACTLPGTPAASVAVLPDGRTFAIGHPTGVTEILVERDASGAVAAAGTVRTARKLFEDRVYPRD